MFDILKNLDRKIFFIYPHDESDILLLFEPTFY